MSLTPILFLGGLVIFLWLFLWYRQRRPLGYIAEVESVLRSAPVSSGDAVLVSREHGQLIYANESARHWFGLDGGEPDLEVIARQADPQDSFLELLVHETQSSFQLAGRWVEATSHRIPSGAEMRTVILMRELSANTAHPEALNLSTTMAIINEIGETINASLGVDQALQTLLTIVGKAVPADAGSVCLWDEEQQALYPRGWVGNSAYIVALAEAGGMYRLGEGITGWIAQHRRPVLVNNLNDDTAVRPKLEVNLYQSFVGVPLMLGERFIGTLEFASGKMNSFTQAHMALLQAISKQVATSVYNAELYAEQTRRIDEIANLQEITRQHEGVEQVYKALTERVARLLGADVCGVLLYDERKQALVAQLPFYGLPPQLVRNFSIPVQPDSQPREIFEQRAEWISNDLSDETLSGVMNLEVLVNAAGLYNTALTPMQIGTQRIGMLQVANKRHGGGFNTRDIQSLRILAAQAATVVENLRLYESEQRRDTELTGLQEMTHAIGALSHEGEFYSDITERIARLMNISMCGILLYDRENNRLVSRPPFYGIDDALVANYAIELKPGSRMEAIWNNEDTWYTNHAGTDPIVFEAGLAELAAAIGVTKTMIAVLAAGGQRIGVVQVSNKLNGEDFTETDARLLVIFATQAAALIENARLYREMQRRAHEAESVRQVAELAGAILTADDSLTPMLAKVSELMGSPLVFVSTFVEDTNTLATLPRAMYGIELSEPIVYEPGTARFEQIAAIARKPVMSAKVITDNRLFPGYNRLADDLNVTTLLIVPLLVGERSLGELGVANRATPYTEDDRDVLLAIAAQIASAVDRLQLHQAIGQNLSRRLQELDALARVSNELTQTLELDRVLEVIRQEAIRATDAAEGSVVVLMKQSEWIDENNPRLDHRLGEPKGRDLLDIEREAILQRGIDVVLVDDYANSTFVDAPEGARSALAVAFTFGNEVVGVLHLYDSQPQHFDNQAATFLITLAAKASLGYANAMRYLENVERSTILRRRVEQLNQIFELGQVLQTSADTASVLEAIAYSVQQSAGFDVVVMLLADHTAGVMFRLTQAGMPLEDFEKTKDKTITLAQLANLLRDEYRTSDSYFFPYEKIGDWFIEGVEALSTSYAGKRSLHGRGKNEWRDGDLLVVPLHGVGGELLGLMCLDRPFNNQRPDRSVIEILEIFAHQATTTMENTRLYLESVNNAEQEARINEMVEAIASTLDVNQIVEAVARGALRLLPFVRMTVALIDPEQTAFDVLWATVKSDNSIVVGKDQRKSLDNTALGRTFENGQEYLYAADDPLMQEYEDLSRWYAEGERTSLVVPLITGGLCLGAMHLGADLIGAFGFNEFRPLLKRMANLAAVAIQNARLFNQAVNLRAFNESVVQSIQQGIIVLDLDMRIVSINDYMRQHFGWTNDALRQDLVAYQPELAFLAEDVRSVLETAAPRERRRQRLQAEDSLGDIRIESFYIYPLRSADSVRGVVVLTEDETERARLEQDIETRANQLAVLTEVSGRITATLNRADVIALALNEMARIIAYDTMTIWRREGDFLVLESARGIDVPSETRVSIAWHERLHRVILTQQAYTISRLQGWDSLPGEQGMQSWLGVPLVRQNEAVGMIALCKDEAKFYDAQAEQAAFTFANQVAVSLANADLYNETERRTQRLALLNRASLALAQSLDNENIMEIALREIAEMIRVEKGRAILIERDMHIGRTIVDYPRGDFPPDQVFEITSTPTLRHITRTVTPLIIEDIAQVPASDALFSEIRGRGVQAYLAIPMAVGGQAIGILELEIFDGARHFEPEQIELGLIIANQAAIAVQNANLLEQTMVRTRELETLLEAAQATSYTLDLDEVFQNIARLMLQALDMDNCAIMMYSPIEGTLEIQIELNRFGTPDEVRPPGTRLNLRQYPTRQSALEKRQVIIIERDDPKADTSEIADMGQNHHHSRMVVPLISGDQAIGMAQLDVENEMRRLTHREVRMAQALGAQAATAIENARLSTETAARVEELLVINDISRAISATMDIQQMIGIVRAQVPNLTDAEEVYLALYEPETQQITFPMAIRQGHDYEIPSRPLGNDEVSFVIRHRRWLPLGGDFSLDEMRRNLGIINGEGDAKAYLGVPLISGDIVLGVLAVRNVERKKSFGLNDQRILTTIGTQLGAAIQNARLFHQISNFAQELNQRVQERTLELQQERDRLDTLYRLTSELARTLDIDRVLNSALRMAVSAISADDAAIILVKPTGELYNRASIQRPMNGSNGVEPYHPAQMLAEWLVENPRQRAIQINDLSTFYYWEMDKPGAAEWRSAIAVVLEINEVVMGAMVFLSRQENTFTEAHLRLVNAASNQVAAAISNSDLYNLIREQSEHLASLLRSVQEEAEKNAAILESIADGVVLADASGNIILFNTAAERIFELPRSAMMGQPFTRLMAQFESGMGSRVQTVNDWVKDPSRTIGDLVIERIELGNRVVAIRLSPVYIGEQLLGTVSVFRDITRDVEVDRMKSEFISNVSHELRTPMTSIKGYADLLIIGAAGMMNEQQQRFVSTIKNNTERLSALVNDLLNISRLDSGAEPLTLELVNVGEVVQRVLTSVEEQPNHKSKGIRVLTDIDPNLPRIEADANGVSQVLTSIIDNAFNYTYAGGSIEIGASRRDDKPHVLITVKDSGIGIPKQFQSRIWGRFERFEEHALVMEVAGTGLGLPIAKNLVDLHNGEIWFESEENVGTTFYVSLPISQSTESRILSATGKLRALEE